MNGWMDEGCRDGGMDGWRDGWIDEWMDEGCRDGGMDGWRDAGRGAGSEDCYSISVLFPLVAPLTLLL